MNEDHLKQDIINAFKKMAKTKDKKESQAQFIALVSYLSKIKKEQHGTLGT